MSNALEQFHVLEERIAEAVDLIEITRAEKGNLEKELAAAKAEILELQKEITGLHKQTGAVRGRVEGLISSISELTEERLV